MDVTAPVTLRIENIRNTFIDALELAAEQPNVPLLITELENIGAEFRSIAYEGASVAIAIKDLYEDETFSQWNAFKELTQNHQAQVHAGLGWALSQLSKPVFPIIDSFTPLMQGRIVDGYGYYDGYFRQRQSIKNKIVPEQFQNSFLAAYDQGIGRSLWYASKGDVTIIPAMVQEFPDLRHTGLWRGIGTACAYVGGCDELTLNLLFNLAEQYQPQLSAGAALAARARAHANSPSSGSQLACELWCKLSVKDAMILTVKTETASNENPTDGYNNWLIEIEKVF